RFAWLSGAPELDLIVTMDDATSTIYSAFLVEEEGTVSTFRGLLEVFTAKGLAASLYTDRGSHYFYTPKAGDAVDKSPLAQVGRALRIRLPPRVWNGKAIARPGMENDRFREKVFRQLRHPCPRDPILLTASPQRAPPEVSHMLPEHAECTRIGRHRVIVEVATEDLPQPFPLLGDRPVHAPSQRFLDLP